MAGVLLAFALPAEPQRESVLGELQRYEMQLLEQIEDQKTAPFVFGSDPFAVVYLATTQQTLVLLRNASEVLLLDSSMRTVDRKPAPRAPRGWTIADERHLWITGELSDRIFLYEVAAGELVHTAEIRLAGAAGLRDIAYASQSESLFAIDTHRRELIQVELAADWRAGNRSFRTTAYPIGAGPLQLEYRCGFLFLNLLLDHRIDIIPLAKGYPDFSRKQTIAHNGPIWGFDVTLRGADLLVASVGVEDRALDRTRGEFGYVDSFLFLYELPASGGSPLRRMLTWNLSAQNVVTPKTVRFMHESDGLRLVIAGFGSDRGIVLGLSESTLSPKHVFRVPPGTTDIALIPDAPTLRLLAASTLLDRVYDVAPKDGTYTTAPLDGLDNRYPSARSRIGELLFFTTLFSPHNRTEGQLSRFTCETCHFEGTIDGRVHFTGRGEVFATTKTLRSLANNIPLFSRAGDRSLASMVLQEFHVANQNRQAEFSIDLTDYPWLGDLGQVPSRLEPADLRKDFLSFLVHFQHTPNPWLVTRKQLSRAALAGMEVFRARCEYCHQATLSTRSNRTVSPDKWQVLIEDEASDLVWGAPFYTKTNILPYVSTKGARVPSLRRVSEKYPYFTNGSSRDLRSVLERYRFRGATAWHHYNGPDQTDIEALSADEIDQLEALLRYF